MSMMRELAVAIDAARAGGAVLRRYFGTGLSHQEKAGGEPVTKADREAQVEILAVLRQSFADDAFLAEEDQPERDWHKAQRVWMVDPMDGTRDFIAGRKGFSVMIGLCIGGMPTIGVVLQPTRDLLYAGIVGGQATITRGSAPSPLKPTTIVDPALTRLVSGTPAKSTPPTSTAPADDNNLPVGSVGLKIGLIAEGAADLYLNPDGHCRLWDTCGPQAILQAAGGKLTDLYGQPLCYTDPQNVRLARGVVASNGACHDATIQRLAPLLDGRQRRAKPPQATS